MQKIKQHLYNNKSTYISCCVVFFVLLIMFATKHIWPFGKNTFAIFDLSNQIIPLGAHVYDIFEGKASLFYSNRWASGMNTFASLVYFICSPLYLLMFLGGRNNMIYLVNLVIVAYFICMTISINYMMKKLFKLNTVFQTIISLCYCFCGYILQNYTFIVWLNYLVLMPLVVVAFKRLVEKEKYLTFSFLIFAYIISCFGVGTTTMFVLLGIFYLYVLLCMDKDKRKKTLTRLTVALLFAVLISSIVIVPAWLSSRLGTRSGQLFDYVFTSEIDRGWPKKITYVVVDFAFSVLSVVFVVFCNKKDKVNKFLSIVLMALVFIHFVDACLMLLCFGQNNGYYNRLDFLLLICSIIAICKFFVDSKVETEQTKLDTKTQWIKFNWKNILAVGMLIGFAVAFLTMIFANKFDVKEIAKPIVVHNEVEDDALYILNNVLLVVVPFLLVVLLFKFKQIHYKAMQIAMCVLLGCQAVLGGVIFANMNFDMETINTTSNLVSEYYGDYDKGYGIMKNIAGFYDTSNSSIFTSMLPQKTYDAYSYLGYDTKFNYVVTSSDSGTVFTDSLIGVKYRLFAGLVDNDLWTTVDNTNDGGAKYCLQNFNFSTTGAFLIDQDYKWDWSQNSFENQNKLARAMGANSDIFEIIDLKSVATGTDNANVVINKRNTYLKNGIFYAYAGKTGNIEILTTGEKAIFYLAVDEDYYYECLKKSSIDKSINKNAIYNINNVNFKFESEGLDLSKIYLAKLDIQNYAEQFGLIKQNQVEIKYYSNGCKFDINTHESKKLFVSNVNIKGMSAKINGKKVQVEDVATGFVGINLNVGENSIDVYYKSPILLPSIIVCILCIAIAILVIVLYNKGKLNWLDKIVDKAYFIYGVALVSFLFVFTGVLTVIKILI